MIKLFLKPNDIPALTSFSGNIDIDQLAPCISIAQQTYIKRVLGLNLYNKIYVLVGSKINRNFNYAFSNFFMHKNPFSIIYKYDVVY
jgi:hypothetical protein